MRHLEAILIGALTLYGLSADCLAAAPSDADRTKVVRFADLDVTHRAGAQELYRRIRQAAQEVCERDYGYAQCVSGAIARAVNGLGVPLLAEPQRALTD